jgi:hypothetical protein
VRSVIKGLEELERIGRRAAANTPQLEEPQLDEADPDPEVQDKLASVDEAAPAKDWEADPRPLAACLKDWHARPGWTRGRAAQELRVPRSTYDGWCVGRPAGLEKSIRRLMTLISE